MNIQSYDSNQCECGLLLNFSPVFSVVPGSGDPGPSGAAPNIPAKDTYVLRFSNDTTIPSSQTTVSIIPDSYTISNSKIFIPQTSVKIKSTHNGDSQSLIKLNVLDIYNNILHTDYIKIICSSQKVFKKLATINTGNENALGPNGGSLMSVDSNGLKIGMLIRDPIQSKLLPFTKILSIISNNTIEISTQTLGTAQATPIYYEFIESNRCYLPKENETFNYINLNHHNNWTYEVNNHIVAKFTKYLPNDRIDILLSANNQSRLPDRSQPQSILSHSIISTSGNLPDRNIGQLIFNNNTYNQENIILYLNGIQMSGMIQSNMSYVTQFYN